jgi:hypothetical protein
MGTDNEISLRVQGADGTVWCAATRVSPYGGYPTEMVVIIIIHLLGLALAGCLAAPDNGP